MSRKVTSKRKYNRNARKAVRRAMNNGASDQYGNKNLTKYMYGNFSAMSKALTRKE